MSIIAAVTLTEYFIFVVSLHPNALKFLFFFYLNLNMFVLVILKITVLSSRTLRIAPLVVRDEYFADVSFAFVNATLPKQ